MLRPTPIMTNPSGKDKLVSGNGRRWGTCIVGRESDIPPCTGNELKSNHYHALADPEPILARLKTNPAFLASNGWLLLPFLCSTRPASAYKIT